MRTWAWRIPIVFCLIALSPGASAQVRTIELRVLSNGHYKFGTEPEISRAALPARIRKLMRERPRPEIHVIPERLVRYDGVALLFATFQKMGYGAHFGFTGIENQQ